MRDTPQQEEREREKRLLILGLQLGNKDIVLRAERLRIRAQYEDKNFLRLVGSGMIRPEKL